MSHRDKTVIRHHYCVVLNRGGLRLHAMMYMCAKY